MNMVLFIVGCYLEYKGFYVSGAVCLFITFTTNFDGSDEKKAA